MHDAVLIPTAVNAIYEVFLFFIGSADFEFSFRVLLENQKHFFSASVLNAELVILNFYSFYYY